MRIVHRFYDLFVGGAEVVVLNTVKALREHEHVLLFSRSTPSWIAKELHELPNATLRKLEPGTENRAAATVSADLYLFHYYPPMSEADFLDLPPRVLTRTLLVNHWHHEVPLIDGVGYLFLSLESRQRTGGCIPSKVARVLINPVADCFFRLKRQEVQCSVGRHSREAEFKFSSDFFELHESIRPGELNVFVLGAPLRMQQFVQRELSEIKNHYWLMPFGSLKVPNFLASPQVYLYKTRDDFAETCPMNILEAMASGIPIVAEEKGGIRSLIKHGETGYLCKNPLDFIEYSNSLLDCGSTRTQISNAAREWARDNASLGDFGERLMAVASELLSRR